MIPRPPATMPASLAAIVTIAGLALIYWSLVGLGLLRPADAPPSAAAPTAAPSSVAAASQSASSLVA